MIVLLGIFVLLFAAYEFMKPFTPKSISEYAANAGFSGFALVEAVAIAYAESSGDPNAVGDNGTSYGLWQIHYTVHPEFDPSQLFDPQYNANAAFSIYEAAGNSFSPWTTFNSGAYTKYLEQAGSELAQESAQNADDFSGEENG